MFWTIFLAVLCAWWVTRWVAAWERHRDYCHKEALKYTWMWRIDIIARRTDGAAEMMQKEALDWEKQTKGWRSLWIPIYPPQDSEFEEQSQEDEIRQLIKDFNEWTSLSDEKRKEKLKEWVGE